PWIRSLSPTSFIVAAITHVKIYSALARKVRGRTLLATDYAKLIRIFDYDMERRFRIIDITRPLCRQAGQLAEKHGLRGYDSVQLACALKADSLLKKIGSDRLTFLTADAELLKAGAAEGLSADNPETH
ncbi:MAG: type II toxin-antitoxin system VapC family toxin, partial [Anaerolineae bacterium]|nr:type II toxin-antitoxin system VapC family toxin [Anaerolineae bacterium]